MCLSLILLSCDKDTCVHGEGPVVSKEIDLAAFNSIDLKGSLNVIVKQGTEQKVVAIGQENIISYLSTSVKAGNWDIMLENGCYNDYELTIEITTNSIEELGTSGTGNVQLDGNFVEIENISFFNNGSGQVYSNDSIFVSNFLFVNITSNGSISLKGLCENQNIGLSGSGNYYSYELFSENCIVSVPGSGYCKVNVGNNLDVFIGGSGNVYYLGNPDITSTVTGSGEIINEN